MPDGNRDARDRIGAGAYRLTVRQFEKMIDAGIFPHDSRVELLGGFLVERMTKNDPHNFAVDQLADDLRRIVAVGWFIREEKSVVLGHHDRPEPDIVVVRGDRRNFHRAPRSQNLALLIEVADTTYAKDRGPMWRRYAAAGIPVSWIVNLAQRLVEVYSEPAGRGGSALYRTSMTYGQEAEVPVVIDGDEIGRILVKDLLTPEGEQ